MTPFARRLQPLRKGGMPHQVSRHSKSNDAKSDGGLRLCGRRSRAPNALHPVTDPPPEPDTETNQESYQRSEDQEVTGVPCIGIDPDLENSRKNLAERLHGARHQAQSRGV